jgi:hypothetical protein
MFRHIVLLTLKADTPEGQSNIIVKALRDLPAAIPEIANYVVGQDAEIAEGNADIAIVADFANADDYEVYRTHPVHLVVIQMILPFIAGRAAVQHAVAG